MVRVLVPLFVVLQDGFTALHRSCVTGNTKVIEYLLSRKANVNMEDSVSGDCFSPH